MHNLLLIFLVTLTGCSYFKPLPGISPVKVDFIQHDDSRVIFKSGMKNQADLVSIYLDEEISNIENMHGKPFTKPVTVHICDSTKCFDKYSKYGEKIKAGVNINGLNLSPLIFQNEYHQKFVSHELSHLHLFQQISLFDAYFIPQWLHDGIATLASKGGGATMVTEKEAINHLINGKNIIPIDFVWILTNRWPTSYAKMDDPKVQQHMNYKQASLFVEYLNKKKSIAPLIRLLEKGESFKSAFKLIYNTSPNNLWNEYYSSLHQL